MLYSHSRICFVSPFLRFDYSTFLIFSVSHFWQSQKYWFPAEFNSDIPACRAELVAMLARACKQAGFLVTTSHYHKVTANDNYMYLKLSCTQGVVFKKVSLTNSIIRIFSVSIFRVFDYSTFRFFLPLPF